MKVFLMLPRPELDFAHIKEFARERFFQQRNVIVKEKRQRRQIQKTMTRNELTQETADANLDDDVTITALAMP